MTVVRLMRSLRQRVMQAFGSELGGRDLAVHEGNHGAVGKAVVGRLAGSGTPLLGVLGDDFDGRAESGDLDGPDPPGVADLATKLEGRGDRRLAVILGRDELDRGLRQHPIGGQRPSQLGQIERAGNLLDEPHLAFEERRGAGHPQGGELGGEDAVAGGEGESAALPHREFPGACEPQCRAGRAGDSQRVEGLIMIQMPQPCSSQG